MLRNILLFVIIYKSGKWEIYRLLEIKTRYKALIKTIPNKIWFFISINWKSHFRFSILWHWNATKKSLYLVFFELLSSNFGDQTNITQKIPFEISDEDCHLPSVVHYNDLYVELVSQTLFGGIIEGHGNLSLHDAY